MALNPFALQTPDSVESILEGANATCARFNHGRTLFSGHYLATGRNDGFIAVWDVETKNLVRWFEGHVRAVTDVAWSSHNRYLASASEDWNVIVWDLKRSDPDDMLQADGVVIPDHSTHSASGHGRFLPDRRRVIRMDGPVRSVTFSPSNSHQLAVVTESQQLYLIDLSRRPRRRLDAKHSLSNGTTRNGSVKDAMRGHPSHMERCERRWELALGSQEDQNGPSASTRLSLLCSTFHPSGRFVFSGTSRGEIVVHSVETHRIVGRLNVAGASGVRQLAFDRLGRHCVCNASDRCVRVLSVEVHEDDSTCTAKPDVKVSASGSRAAGAVSGGVTMVVRHKFQDLVNRTPWTGVGFSGDAEYVFGGAAHKAAHNIYIWDRGAGALDKILEGPREPLIDVDWHPSRPLLASVSNTGVVNLWHTPATEIWSAYAPGFEELEENVEYEEREDEFDLEDEDEVTRRKQDEEEALVDILSLGPAAGPVSVKANGSANGLPPAARTSTGQAEDRRNGDRPDAIAGGSADADVTMEVPDGTATLDSRRNGNEAHLASGESVVAASNGVDVTMADGEGSDWQESRGDRADVRVATSPRRGDNTYPESMGSDDDDDDEADDDVYFTLPLRLDEELPVLESDD